MRNLNLRASWVARGIALALAVAAPVASGLTGTGRPRRRGRLERARPRGVRRRRHRRGHGGNGGAGSVTSRERGAERATTRRAHEAPARARPRDLAVRARPDAHAHGRQDAERIEDMTWRSRPGSRRFPPTAAGDGSRSRMSGRGARDGCPCEGSPGARRASRSTSISPSTASRSRSSTGCCSACRQPRVAASPTPPGEYFVTDRIRFSGGYLGTFAFGISASSRSFHPGGAAGTSSRSTARTTRRRSDDRRAPGVSA